MSNLELYNKLIDMADRIHSLSSQPVSGISEEILALGNELHGIAQSLLPQENE